MVYRCKRHRSKLYWWHLDTAFKYQITADLSNLNLINIVISVYMMYFIVFNNIPKGQTVKLNLSTILLTPTILAAEYSKNALSVPCSQNRSKGNVVKPKTGCHY
eukprot:719986_1